MNVKDREQLKRVLKTKIKTTMIGALSAVEECLGEVLFADPKINAMYQKCRQMILDNGNEQIRNMEKEVDLYTISRTVFTYHMPIKPMKNFQEDQ